MSNSLRDQLIKAGLVTKKQAHETRKRKPRGKQAHQAKRQEKTQRDAELSALDAHKRERDRELNAQREVQRKAREQADWVRQMCVRVAEPCCVQVPHVCSRKLREHAEAAARSKGGS